MKNWMLLTLLLISTTLLANEYPLTNVEKKITAKQDARVAKLRDTIADISTDKVIQDKIVSCMFLFAQIAKDEDELAKDARIDRKLPDDVALVRSTNVWIHHIKQP